MVIQPGTTSTSLLIRLRHDDAEAWERFGSFYLAKEFGMANLGRTWT